MSEGFAELPQAATWNVRRDTVSLLFDGNRTGEYHVRGGICWPVPVGNRAEGALVIGAQDVKSGIVRICGQTPLLCVDHVIDPTTGVIKYRGVAGWLNQGWQSYHARMFYYRQSEDVHKRWALQVLRSKLVEPKPAFRPVVWKDHAEGRALILAWLGAERVIFPAGSPVDHGLRQAEAQSGAPVPVVHAVTALLAGLERYPWRRGDRPYGNQMA